MKKMHQNHNKILVELINKTNSQNSKIFFKELDLKVKKIIGHKLFTLMVVDKSLKYVERVYSSNIKAYPLLGTKPIPKNEWTKKVVLNKKNFLGKDMKTIKKLFFDHEVISSLGCGSIINIPVINNNIILGTMNILHKEFYYNSDTVKLAKPFASLLSGYFLFHQQNMKTK